MLRTLGTLRASRAPIAVTSTSAHCAATASATSSGGDRGDGDSYSRGTNRSLSNTKNTSNKSSNNKSLFLRNLPRSYDVLQVTDLVHEYGPVVSVRINYFQNSRKSKGTCTVEFSEREAAQKALADLQHQTIGNCKEPLEIDWRREPPYYTS